MDRLEDERMKTVSAIGFKQCFAIFGRSRLDMKVLRALVCVLSLCGVLLASAMETLAAGPSGDIVTITAAGWRNGKGGRLDVTATTTSPDAVLSVSEVTGAKGEVLSLGQMDGTACTPAVPPQGTACLTARGIPSPASVMVTSSLGGAATAVCMPDPRRPGDFVCK
jgi:hypothetical protein